MRRTVRLFSLLCGITLSALPGIAAAQKSPWLQIEVILFKHLDENAGNGEQWPEQPQLGYPSPLKQLEDPHAMERAIAEIEDAAWAELARYPIPTPPADNDITETPDIGFATTYDESADEAPAAPDPDAAVEPIDEQVPPLEIESPYVLLDSEQTDLADAYGRLRWSKQFRPLAHIAWRQPRLRRGQRIHVPVSAGERSADHVEVEGSVSIRQAAFMHVHSNLWMSEFAAPRPTGRYGFTLESDIELPMLPKAPEPEVDTDLLLLPLNGRDIAQRLNPDGSPRWGELTEVVVTAQPIGYTAVAAVAMPLDEERRIDMGEVNYFDHPRFGMIISITDYDPVKAAEARRDAADQSTLSNSARSAGEG